MRPLAFLAVALASLVLAGCSTFDSRSQEKAAVFNTLDDDTRDRLKERQIAVGDTFDMVYIALGAPDEKREKVTREGTATTWVYNAYWQEYRGETLVGYRRYSVYDREKKVYRVFYEPVRESVYTPRVEERLRVEFKDGRVTVVEEAKR